jgi:hypothetical protein
MSEILSVAEIEERYPNEWILVEEPSTNETLEVQSGKVRWHSPDRDETYRKAVELRPPNFAFLYTGTIPENTEIVL